MKSKLHLFIWPVFVLVVLAQWAVPVQMIMKKDIVLQQGIKYKFLVAPIDPNDYFRGKYIVLNFRDNFIKVREYKNTRNSNNKIFVTFQPDKSGFARIREISDTRPARKDYLESEIWYMSQEKDSTSIFIEYPFNKFYMEEYKAPEAERVFSERLPDATQKAYALVSILKGDAVINDVFINDTSIQQVLRNRKY
jgi:uncharacterized membrane-anchored protein